MGNRTILSPEWIADLLETCLKFSYGGIFYEQKEGMAVEGAVMGSLSTSAWSSLRSWHRDIRGLDKCVHHRQVLDMSVHPLTPH